MEHLLSTSFDLLSSYESSHIRKGLRCLEGLLSKLCSPTAPPADFTGAVSARPCDAAFKEFLRLQAGFEWNVTLRLISCLERLLGRTNNSQTNTLIHLGLSLIQGTLLLHPPSRKLFAREIHMNVLLDLLDTPNTHEIQAATLLTLVCALLDHPQNTRTFEALDGLATVAGLFRNRDTPREVKVRILEFLYFYLMPEKKGGVNERSSEEKQKLLGGYVRNVETLARDLREAPPYGVV